MLGLCFTDQFWSLLFKSGSPSVKQNYVTLNFFFENIEELCIKELKWLMIYVQPLQLSKG
jgi:hypothetical protein